MSASLVVSRRALLRGVGLVVVGGVGGFVWARNSAAAKGGTSSAAANGYGYTPPKAAGASRRKLATLSSIPSGGGVVLSGEHVVLTRDSSGAVHAFSAVCTHQGCTVSGVHGGVISCPCHGSRFNADTGAVVAGPATQPLPPVAVTVTGGVVYAQ